MIKKTAFSVIAKFSQRMGFIMEFNVISALLVASGL